MSKLEILEELPKLSVQDRAEIQARIEELADSASPAEGDLTDAEKRLLDARLDECERDPSGFVPWSEAKNTILASLKK